MHTTPHRVYPILSFKNKTSEKGFCNVSHSACTYVPSLLIYPLLCMSLLTQREMSVLHRRQVCTERLLHIGHSFIFNLPLEVRK